MHVFRGASVPFQKADARSFVGDALTKRLAQSDDGVPVTAYRVEFDAGSRTNWHVHSGAQWLFVVEGRIRIQRWGDAPLDADPGDTIVITPGEKHWHGAAPGSRGVHIAVNVNATTEWMESVSEDDYQATTYSPST
jgi:quercetin dioxygenase-like cupin family protein